MNEIADLTDHVRIDSMGSIVATIPGASSDIVMVTAHMDEIGFIVSHIDDKGFIRFHPLGGFDPKTLTSQRVIVHGREDVMGALGTKPIHRMAPEDRKKATKREEYFINTGRRASEINKLLSVADHIT